MLRVGASAQDRPAEAAMPELQGPIQQPHREHTGEDCHGSGSHDHASMRKFWAFLSIFILVKHLPQPFPVHISGSWNGCADDACCQTQVQASTCQFSCECSSDSPPSVLSGITDRQITDADSRQAEISLEICPGCSVPRCPGRVLTDSSHLGTIPPPRLQSHCLAAQP